MLVPEAHRKHVFALLLKGGDVPIVFVKGSLQYNPEEFIYTAVDPDGDGLMVDVDHVYGVLFDASDTD